MFMDNKDNACDMFYYNVTFDNWLHSINPAINGESISGEDIRTSQTYKRFNLVVISYLINESFLQMNDELKTPLNNS